MRIRIDKYLSNMGIGTRSEVKDYIKKGLVTVNGELVKKPSQQIDTEDTVRFRQEEILFQEYFYFMLNKPAGIISATEGQHYDTVCDLLPEEYKDRGIFPAGRLDKDTEGLILLTNDGKLSHYLLSPKREVPKTYYVELEEDLREDAEQILSAGIFLEPEEIKTAPAKLQRLEARRVLLTISEGKYHQVKRMMHACSNEVTYLKRIQMGPLKLDPQLEKGALRPLTEEEKKLLFEVTGYSPDEGKTLLRQFL